MELSYIELIYIKAQYLQLIENACLKWEQLMIFFNWMCFLTWPCGYVLSLITGSWIVIIIVQLWKSYRIQNLCLRSFVNSLWFTDTKWQHRFWSTVAQVIAWCLMAPSHFLNQCWLINGVLWQSHECNFTSAKSLRGQWVKLRKNMAMKMGMILCTPWHHSHNEGELGLDEKKMSYFQRYLIICRLLDFYFGT